jgi:hypothetical protein
MPEVTENQPASTELKLAWGAAEIGKLIRRPPRAVYHMYASGQLAPAVRQFGRKLVGNVSELQKLFGA